MRTLLAVTFCLAVAAAACESVPAPPVAAPGGVAESASAAATVPAPEPTGAAPVPERPPTATPARDPDPPAELAEEEGRGAPAQTAAAQPATEADLAPDEPTRPAGAETFTTGQDVVAAYGEMWPWVSEAWTFSKLRLYDVLRDDDHEETCEARWRPPCASGTPWWVSLPDLSPAGAVLHYLALLWQEITPDTTEWDNLQRAFGEHYDDCYNRRGQRLAAVLLTETMAWAVVDGNALGDYGNYSEDATAGSSRGDCAADTAEPPPHLRKALEAILFNCSADREQIDAAGWSAVADRACPRYAPFSDEDYGTGACAPATRTGDPVSEFTAAPARCIDTAVPHTAVFHTSRGQVAVALDVTNTPGTVNNFVNLARFGYYDGTLIHRGAPGLGILQGGSPYTNPAVDPGPGYTLQDEGTGFTYQPGQLVMARGAGADSATAQFLFTVTDEAALLDDEGAHVVFGEVVEGFYILEESLWYTQEPLVVETVTINEG